MAFNGTEKRKYNQKYYRHTTKKTREDAQREDQKKGVLTARIPMQLIARLTRIKDEGIATGAFPWRSMSGVVEALLIRGLESLAGDPFIDEMLQYLRVTSQIDGIAAHRREAQAAVARVKVEVAELLKIKATDEAATYFHAILHDLRAMDATIWRDWAIKDLRKTYPALLTIKPIAIRPRAGRERRQQHRGRRQGD